MRFALLKTGLAAGIFLSVRIAAAFDGGDQASDPDAAAAATLQDAAVPVDGPAIACDGALCETKTGTTCAVAGAGPGRLASSKGHLFALLAVSAVASLVRRSARPRLSGAVRPTERPGMG